MNLINLKDFKIPPDGIYIGRWNPRFPASPLANPFKISEDCSRDQAIAQYRLWLWQQMQADTPALRELQRIQQLELTESVTLMCWCYPLPCHGDIVIRAIEWLKKKRVFKMSTRTVTMRVVIPNSEVSKDIEVSDDLSDSEVRSICRERAQEMAISLALDNYTLDID